MNPAMKKKRRTKKMEIKINMRQLKRVCQKSIQSFQVHGDVYETADGIYIHKDNGSNVLAVAHLDTALKREREWFHHIQLGKDNDLVYNTGLDDRLGAYIILYLLPSLGVKYDILLTEGEEICRSTAWHFESSKQYNWMFSFDRKGTDVVMYQYESRAMRKRLAKLNITGIGKGSFSDIGELEHLECKGLNFGTGYYNEHTVLHYANLVDTRKQVQRFYAFYEKYRDVHLHHEYAPEPEPEPDEDYDYGYDDKFLIPLCKSCGWELASRTEIITGMCSACEPHITTCVLCDNTVDSRYTDEEGFCPPCQRAMEEHDEPPILLLTSNTEEVQ